MGPLHIIAAFQEKKLFVHLMYKVSLSPEVEWDDLACRDYVQSSDPQSGILGVEGMPVFVVQ